MDERKEDLGDTEPARPRRKDPFWLKPVVYGLLLVASLIIGVQIFNFVIMPAFVGHRDEVTVPDLAGKDVETAEALLVRAGLKLGDTRQRHDARPAGTIVAQHPGAGSSVKGGRTVAVIVSRGEAAGVVPRLDGQSMRNARLELETAGLNLGEIVSVPSQSVPQDVIIATEPSAGSTAPRGTPVNLLVSTGGSSRTYVMPDLRGRDASEVEISLREAGFTVEVADGGIRLFRGRRLVVDHQPAPGTRVTAASHITLHTD